MTAVRPTRAAVTGVVGGIIGAAVMGMFAMIAAATYQKTGGFTPLYHIASSVIEPAAMETSMKQAMNGNLWYFAAGPAVAGVAIHLAVGAFWGLVFGLIAALVGLSRPVAPVLGAVYGLLVMVVMAFVGLPVVASILGGGPPIRDMAQMVGWPTFAAEHAIFGLILGSVWALAGGAASIPEGAEGRARVRA